MKEFVQVLKAKQLGRVVSSQSLSTLANRMISFVIPWLVLERTGSALNAGGVAFAMGLAAMFGTMFGGLITDRIGGRKASIISDVFSFVTVLILPLVLLFDFLPLWLIIVTQTLGVLFDGAGAIGKDTLVPRAAADDKVPLIRATSLQETFQGIANFVGPLAAGLLIGFFSESLTLVIVSIIFAICIFLISGVRKQKIEHEHPLTVQKAVEDTKEGFAFVLKEPLLGPITLLLVGLTALLFPLATIVFPAWFVFTGQSAEALGIFLGAQALGAIIGGMLFAVISTKVSARKWLIYTIFISAVMYGLLLLMQPDSVLSVVVSFIAGIVTAGLWPIIFTAYYARTPEKLMGRVNGASSVIMLAAVPVSSLFFGWLISVTDVKNALVVVAIGALIIAAVAALMPSLKLLDINYDQGKVEPSEVERG